MFRVVVSAPLGNALHAVRREEELTGKLWSFTPLAGEYAGETFPVAVSSCWESYPAFGNYRGEGRYSTRFTARLFRDGTPVDDLVDRFGFREVRVEGKRILLNGAPLRVKGVCRHEDHPHYGCALPFAAMAHDLALIRDLGANSVRTAHHEQQGRVRRIPPPQTVRRSREKNLPRNIKTRVRG